MPRPLASFVPVAMTAGTGLAAQTCRSRKCAPRLRKPGLSTPAPAPYYYDYVFIEALRRRQGTSSAACRPQPARSGRCGAYPYRQAVAVGIRKKICNVTGLVGHCLGPQGTSTGSGVGNGPVVPRGPGRGPQKPFGAPVAACRGDGWVPKVPTTRRSAGRPPAGPWTGGG